MKKIYLLLGICLVIMSTQLVGQNSDKITRVLEYKPAPGQHINRLFPTPAMSDTPENALKFASDCLINNKSMLGLGAYGGYVIVGFDHPIVNVANEYDFKALGNAYTNASEPGIVMVCQDLNKNGKPDTNEPWYELAGSEFNHASTIHNYEITYFRPIPDGQKSNIRWTDNQGAEGIVTHISFASQATIFPLWITENSVTFKGTRLRKNAVLNGSIWTLTAFDWGYADNYANNSENDKIGFDIDWAVDSEGNRVELKYIDFIKVYTGISQEAGIIGETSTELAGIVDLHPDAEIVSGTKILNDTKISTQIKENQLIVKSNDDIKTIELYNINGTKLIQENNRTTLDISSLSKGIYIIKIENKNGWTSMKIIKPY